MAAGDYDARVAIRLQDEIGQLGTAFNTMAGEIQSNITQQEQANKEMLRIKTGLDNSSTNVMICDRELTIIYVNKKSVETLEKHEKEIQKVIPGFAVSKLIGANIDGYHKNPAHQRKLLEDPRNFPFQAEIKLGPLTLELNIGAIISDSG